MQKCEIRKLDFVLLVVFVLYTYVLNVSMRFNISICIYEHIYDYMLKRFSKIPFLEVTDMHNLICLICELLIRPWELSHRVERQKTMLIRQEKTSVCVQKGGFVANLLLRSNVGPSVLLQFL